ncbi:MAG: glycosyltransferase involved in cell wall biosynthesis [Planctomycetota bacterium]|jgi:glycosyltransferase involved in cell wall biosynthesis
MISGARITVTVPAHNEGRLIEQTIHSIPLSVDRIIVVDDASTDDTTAKVEKLKDDRIQLIRREKNGGVGAAIVTGYRAFLEDGGDICVVMAGDAQMDPADLEPLIAPIVDGKADYAKGNRLITADVRAVMPKGRFVGNIVFTMLTKIASGYWHVVDSQCGYAAISRETLGLLDLDSVYDRYGVPNDLLIKLNVIQARVCDVPVRAIYDEEVSGINPWTAIPKISFLLLRGFWWRMWQRYVLRDFHPLVLLYCFGSLFSMVGFAGAIWIACLRLFIDQAVTFPTVMGVAIFLIVGIQSLLFAMTFDMLHNNDLRVRAK